ncbi:MAG: HDIG domain-containing metalloprotein [Chloroflexota bacterium]
MLAQRAEDVVSFTRRDAGRLAVAAVVLIAALTAILGADIFPQRVALEVGDVASEDVVAPRARTFVSDTLTEEKQQAARLAIPPQYDYTTENAIAVAAEQLAAFDRSLFPLERAFDPDTTVEERLGLIDSALPGLSDEARASLRGLEPSRWPVVRTEARRVLDATERTELRDTAVAETRARLGAQMAGGLVEAERMLATELIAPFVAPNSSFSEDLTSQARDRAAADVLPVTESMVAGEVIVRTGSRVTLVDAEKIKAAGLADAVPDFARFGGWAVLATLLIGALLAWMWRFRREFWHRNNVLVLVGVLLLFAAFALKLTAGRAALPFVLPLAAVGILMAILLDTGAATVVLVVLALLAGIVNGNSLELSTYVFLGGFAGILAIRRGDRLQVFLQAGTAVFVVQAAVIATFALLGERDVTGIVQLIGAAALSAGGAAIVAVGSFAVLGNLFGILTVFQLLELASPSQPLLRRLLVETPGTYHHSIMVGNLAERAAEAIGADPLVARVAAYYHDIGKLTNPLAFIENQAGGDNIHDELAPEVSAQVLTQHIGDGIDLAYRARLPKALIAFIPQHHGTAAMSYFLARAREQAAEAHGGLSTERGRKAAAAVEARRYRHAGPKPQSREAALIMLADGVEASVRSLASRDEPAIRAMVGRIISERMDDGQFDECDLTLRDVEKVREAFVQQLLGMYHSRVAYPQNKVVELEARREAARAATGGGGSAVPPDAGTFDHEGSAGSARPAARPATGRPDRPDRSG